MADVLAIVSKAVFEKEAGKSPALGSVLGMDRYITPNKALQPLAEGGGGRLYLVTVRPPDERLWLVAVLDRPKFDGKQWKAKPSAIALCDITKLKAKLKFATGKGITAAPGALGMSLQTPRVLAAADVVLLDAAAGAPPPAPSSAKISGGGHIKDAPSGVAPAGGARDALLEAVLADPLSAEPRRVYADVLTSHNDRRGDFIMLELALAGGVAIRKRPELTARRDELYKKYAKTWFPVKPELVHVARGFVEAVRGSFSAVNTAAAKLFPVEPVTYAHLTFVADELPKVLKAPWLARLHRLAIRSAIKNDGFAQLVAHPNLQQLTALDVTDAGLVGPAGLAELAGYLPNLRALSLSANNLGEAGAEALVAWKGLARLETLYLSGCALEDGGAGVVLSAKLPELVTLALRKNALDAGILKSLANAAKRLPALRFLELNRNDIDAGAAAKAIAALGAAIPTLARVDLRPKGTLVRLR